MAESLKRKAEDALEKPESSAPPASKAPTSVFGAAIAKASGSSGFGGGSGIFAAAVAKSDGSGAATASNSGFGWGFGKDKKSTDDTTKTTDTLSKARNVSVFSNVFQESTKSVFGAAPTGMFSTSTSTASSASLGAGQHSMSSFSSSALGDTKDSNDENNTEKGGKESGGSAFASIAAATGSSAFGSATGRSSLFSTAAQPMFVSAEKAKADLGNDKDGSTAVATVFDKASEKPKSGEEGEQHVRTVQMCKLYCFLTADSETDKKGWQERGKGRLTLNQATDDSSRCRLVMRQEANKRLCLNAPVWSGMCASQVTAKNIRFTAINHASESSSSDGGLPRVWLLQSSKTDEISDLFGELKRMETLAQAQEKDRGSDENDTGSAEKAPTHDSKTAEAKDETAEGAVGTTEMPTPSATEQDSTSKEATPNSEASDSINEASRDGPPQETKNEQDA
eukprot:m.249552 g.249552  ORF g.249552 m.249552 type:complete len:452 (-) comp19526_c0_seq3:143-1498(-)